MLVNIREEKIESLQTFTEQLEKMRLSIQNLSSEVAMHHLVTPLKPGPLSNNLCKKPAVNMDKLWQRAAKFMQLQELWEFRTKVHDMEGSPGHMVKKEMERAPRRHREYLRPIRFAQYTSLVA